MKSFIFLICSIFLFMLGSVPLFSHPDNGKVAILRRGPDRMIHQDEMERPGDPYMRGSRLDIPRAQENLQYDIDNAPPLIEENVEAPMEQPVEASPPRVENNEVEQKQEDVPPPSDKPVIEKRVKTQIFELQK